MSPAATQTVVHLVRHGEVDNPDGVLYGRLPGFGLSRLGESMAAAVSVWLRTRDVALVRASPLERARATAAPVAAACDLKVDIDHRLIEPTNVFEGTRVEFSLAALGHPGLYRHLYNPLRPSWGEPYEQVAARMAAAVADARAEAAGREAVLVSHQLPIWVIRRRLTGRALWHRPDRRQCALASVTSLVFRGARLERIDYVCPAGPTPAGYSGARFGDVGA